MGMSVPIISAAVGVAGTVSGIQSQNAQVQAQNNAISAQISANEQSEQIRRMQADVQRQLINDQYETQRIANHNAFVSERNDLRSLSRQSKTAQRGQIQQLNLQEQQGQLQAESALAQVNAQQRQVEQGINETTIATLNQLSSALGEIQDPTNEIENLANQVESATAQILATSGGRGRTSAAQRGPNQQLIDETLQAISRGEEITAQVAQQLVDTEEFNNLIRQISNTSTGLNTLGIAQQQQALEQNVDFGRQSARLQGQAYRDQINISKDLSRLNKQLTNEQARLNKQLAQGSLITGQALTASQTAAQNAQLASQQVQGPGLISSIGGITNSLLPLAGLFGTSSTTTQQPVYGITTNSALSNLQSRPQPGIITDVTGNIFA